MLPDADSLAQASSRSWEQLAKAVPGARLRRLGGAHAVTTGIALPAFNGVWVERTDPDKEAVAELLDEIAATGLPYCMQLRPGWGAEFEELARNRGLKREASEPAMVLDDASNLADAQHAGRLSVREIAPDEGGLHATVAARGFGHPEEPHRQFMTPAVLQADGTRCYIGEVDGEAVTTSIGVTTDDCVAIFAVATLPAHRAKGYAAAVTARAVSDGLADGVQWAWLSASEAGAPVYARLGFIIVEWWDYWATES